MPPLPIDVVFQPVAVPAVSHAKPVKLIEIKDQRSEKDSIGNLGEHIVYGHKVMPWLKSYLKASLTPDCQFQGPLSVIVHLNKLYIDMDDNNIISAIVVKTQYYQKSKLVAVKVFRGQGGSMHWFDSPSEIRDTLNKAMQAVLDQNRQFICRRFA